jgi:pimeloyl-ACP methyl ester carboxylesterase
MKNSSFNPFLALFLFGSILWSGCVGVPATAPEEPSPDAPEPPVPNAEPVDLDGIWSGELAVGTQKLPLVFRTTPEGNWVMDSPQQGATGIPAELSISGDGLIRITVSAAQGFYEGRLTPEGIIDGTWNQPGFQAPLLLSRGNAAPVLNRPQDPKPPFPYRTEEIRIPRDGFDLAGTLTLPDGPGPFPAVILVSGSGPQNRDEEILGHRPFAVIADHLTREGIAVLRYDDRGVAESGGDFASATSEDLAADALAVLDVLRRRPETDSDRTGLIGHSEGGMIGIYLGYRNPDIPFLVLLAPSVLSGEEQLLLQNEILMRRMGLDEQSIAANSAINRELYTAALSDSEPEERRGRIIEIMTRDAGLPLADAEAQADTLLSPWMRFFLSYDPTAEVNDLAMPTLALFGGLDTQVDADANIAPIDNPGIEVRSYRGLNHLFQEAESGLPAEYGSISETFNPAVLNDISNWIQALP